jgi:transcriptional regulator with XRE-family HTH domain
MQNLNGRNHLYTLRRIRGLRQKQLAHLLGYRSTAMISRLENGRSLPPLPVVFLMEIVLGTRVDEIYVDLFRQMEQVLMRRIDRLPKPLSRQLRNRILRKDVA